MAPSPFARTGSGTTSGQAASRCVWVGAQVASLFDSRAYAAPSVRLVVKTGDDVEVGMGYLLAGGGTDVPANCVAVRSPTFVNDLFRQDEQVVRGPPLFG
jgi:hypothetical protein